MSFSSKILIGLFSGILIGLFLGEKVTYLEFISDSYVNLLRMTVLPYITVSLILNLGSMNASQARMLAIRGGAVLGGLWAIAIALSLLFPLAFPPTEKASFFSTTLLQTSEPFNFVELYIPSNPFHSLANNIVPAVVLFSILLGIAIMRLENKGPFLDVLQVADDAISRVARFVITLTPYGIFAIASVATGTLKTNEIEKIEVYLLTYILIVLVTSLWLLPGLVAAITPIRWRDILGPTRDSLITAFLVGDLFIVLPMLTETSKEILSKNHIAEGQDGNLPEIIIPTSFNFPHTGKLLSLSFILFAAWFTDVELTLTDYPIFILSGLLSFFGSLSAAVPFMLDLFQIPADTFEIFLATSVVNARFGTLLAAVHTIVIALLVSSALLGKIKFNPFRFGMFVLTSLVILASTITGLRLFFSSFLQEDFDGKRIVLDMDPLYPRIDSRINAPLTGTGYMGVKKQNPVLHNILTEGVIRVGFIEDRIPFSFYNSDQELVGLDIELVHLLARDLGVELEFYPIKADHLAEAIASQRIDIAVGGILVTPRRAVEMLCTRAYLEETLAFVVRDDLRQKFSDWNMIRSQGAITVGIENRPYYVREIQHRAPNLDLKVIPIGKDFFDPDLHLDVMAMPAESGSVLTLLHPQYSVVVPKDHLIKVPVVFAVGHNDLVWESWLNTWIRLKEEDETLNNLYRHWILGQYSETERKRWSIGRNILGWWE
jgi:Na+/H+-dicarboxylate symporter/ABC-type amino acid transport substrate-binding protein